jgi:hypothetical protein
VEVGLRLRRKMFAEIPVRKAKCSTNVQKRGPTELVKLKRKVRLKDQNVFSLNGK